MESLQIYRSERAEELAEGDFIVYVAPTGSKDSKEMTPEALKGRNLTGPPPNNLHGDPLFVVMFRCIPAQPDFTDLSSGRRSLSLRAV